MNLPFVGDTFVVSEFLKLKNQFNIETVVETGTNKGDTTYWLAENFNNVYTIEITESSLNEAKNNCNIFKNITYFCGSSSHFMDDIISKVQNEKVMFFLDAHGDNPCPTISELISIKKMNIKPIICIHDFYVPGSNFSWDSYKDFEYRLENIESLICDIYGDDNYTYYYNSEANGCNVGVIYILPKIN